MFKRRFFIGLLSFVQYLSTISTIIFYVLQEDCGLNACKRRLLLVFTWVVAVAADTVSGRAKPPGDSSRGKRFPIQYVLL